MTSISNILINPRVKSPKMIRARLINCWQIQPSAIQGVEVQSTTAQTTIYVTLSVAAWQASPASTVRGTVFMGKQTAVVSLTISQLLEQEQQLTNEA
nr:hypothetical protein [uncultured Arsenicibacter sp.]